MRPLDSWIEFHVSEVPSLRDGHSHQVGGKTTIENSETGQLIRHFEQVWLGGGIRAALGKMIIVHVHKNSPSNPSL